MTKPKYKDIDWPKMWEIFPEAQAFACDDDGGTYWYCSDPIRSYNLWEAKYADGNFIGRYDLEDIDWKDTLKVRPKPKSNQEEFEERIRYMECYKFGWYEEVLKIAKEVFGEV